VAQLLARRRVAVERGAKPAGAVQVLVASVAAEAKLGGTAYERTKSTWDKDAEGNRVRVQKPVRVRAWWEVAGNAVQFGLRYGAVPLQLQPGKSAVEVAKLAELPAVIKLLITAAEAGEMDAAIAGVMAKRGPKEKAVAAQ
jgi:hypothetical protein